MTSTTSVTSSIVSALGAGSGIDMVGLANSLADAQYATRLEQLRSRSQTLEAKVSTASELKNQISQLASALGERVRNGDLSAAPQIANPLVATVAKSPTGTDAGQYSLEVMSLASSQTLAGPAYGAGTDLVGGGTLTIRFGTVQSGSFSPSANDTVNITIPDNATLADVAKLINDANQGVTAYVSNGADGARLVMKGAQGAANGFVVETTESPDAPGLSVLAWQPAGGDLSRLLATSADAQFKVDGISMSSPSNKAGNVVPGVNLTLTGINAGNPTTISPGDASAAISTTMQDLSGALNEIIAALTAATDFQTGDLARDDGARTLRRQLSGLGSMVIMPNAPAGAPKTMAELGLSINKDGSFSFNPATLQKAMTVNPEGVAAMFTNGLYGIYGTIDKIARAATTTGSPGSLAGSVTSYTGQINKIKEQDAKMMDQQEMLRARLIKQFAAADTNINSSKSTLSFLQSQVALWNKSDS